MRRRRRAARDAGEYSATPTSVAASAPNACEMRDPLRHRGHRHPACAIGTPIDRADHQADDDPVVADDLVVQQRADDRSSMPSAASCMPRRAVSGRGEAAQPEDEQDRGGEVASNLRSGSSRLIALPRAPSLALRA